MNSILSFLRLLYGMQPIHVFDKVTQWIVVGWLISHTVSWITVEMVRLWHSTRLKLRRILQQEVAEE